MSAASVYLSGPATVAREMTLPGAVKSDGASSLEVNGALSSVSFGDIAAGETADINAWFNIPPDDISLRSSEILLGADGGIRGTAKIYTPDYNWHGADLQITPTAGWFSAAISAFMAVATFAAIAVLIIGVMRQRASSRV